MKKVGISGSWRIATLEPAVTAKIQADVADHVEAVIQAGDGIVSGGALGVDYWATETALNFATDPAQIEIIIPTPLDIYLEHYRRRSTEGVITLDLYKNLAAQLLRVRDDFSLVEMEHKLCNPETYYSRNTAVVAASGELSAFVVNSSAGAMDTVTKAGDRNLPIKLFEYNF